MTAPEAAISLRQGMRPVRDRVRLALGARWGLLAVATVAVLASGALLACRLLGVWLHPLAPALALLSAGALAAAVGLCWPLPTALLARSVDRRLGLKDRLTTTSCLLARPDTTDMAQAAVDDGLRHLWALRPAQAYPLPGARQWRRLGVALGALLAVQLLPIPPLLLSQARRQELAEVRKQAIQIVPVAKALREEAHQSGDPEAQKAARKLQRLQQDMLRGRLGKKQAALGLDELRKDLKKLAQRSLPNPQAARETARALQRQAANSLSRDAKSLAQKAKEKNQQALARRLEELAKRAKQETRPDALRKLNEEMKAAAKQMGERPSGAADMPLSLAQALAAETPDQMAEQMQAAAQALSAQLDSMTPEQQKQLAEQLAEAAQSAKQAGSEQLAEAMSEAAKALGKGDTKGAKAALGEGSKAARDAAMAAAAEAAGRGLGAAQRGLMGEGMEGDGEGYGYGVGPDDGSQKSVPKNAPGTALFAPRETSVKVNPQAARSRIGPGEPGPLVGSVRGAPDAPGQSRVPYYEVMGDYARSAEEALAKEEVPPAYRTTVRDYFKALETDEK